MSSPVIVGHVCGLMEWCRRQVDSKCVYPRLLLSLGAVALSRRRQTGTFNSPAVWEKREKKKCPQGVKYVPYLPWQPERCQRGRQAYALPGMGPTACCCVYVIIVIRGSVRLLTVSWLIPGNCRLLVLIKGTRDASPRAAYGCLSPKGLSHLLSHPVIMKFTWKTAGEASLSSPVFYPNPLALGIITHMGFSFLSTFLVI